MLFTDGAVEDNVATYAGILVDMTRKQARYFSGQVPQHVMSAGTRHPVAYAEMAPVLIARLLWSRDLKDRPVV
eukprot:1587901-Amphidinium_carterae.1